MSTPPDHLPPPPPTPKPMEQPEGGNAAGGVGGLTARQQQILMLLQAGKGNKEIASELGLHVGTVKQHVVALFKKLNVSNRTMAVARSSSPLPSPLASSTVRPSLPPGTPATHAVENELSGQDSLLERRPCVILSLSIGPTENTPDDAPPLSPELSEAQRRAGGRRLHALLAALAYDYDAVLLARRGHAADIIFGLQHTGEHDLLHAIRTAQTVAADLTITSPQAALHLRGGLTAGLAVASMKRYGGWSGDAVASAGISAARTLRQQAAAGALVIDAAAYDLMASVGIGLQNKADHGNLRPFHGLPFSSLSALKALEPSQHQPLRGRSLELSTLYTCLEQTRQTPVILTVLTGEAGMGKSHLCRAFAERCRKDHISVLRWRCQPDDAHNPDSSDSETNDSTARITCDNYGDDSPLDCVIERLQQEVQVPKPSVVILDDLHWLPLNEQGRLLRAINAIIEAPSPAGSGVFIIVSTRRLRPALHSLLPNGKALQTIALSRLPQQTIATVAADRLGSVPASSPACMAIADSALGVPLFAVELARQEQITHQPHRTGAKDSSVLRLPLSLLSLVSARLDPLGLDRALLRTIARTPNPLPIPDVAKRLQTPVSAIEGAIDRAVSTGVLTLSSEAQTLSFSHPLLRTVINALALDPPS